MNHITQLLEVVRAYREYVDALPKDLALPAMPGFDRDWADTIESQARAALAQPEPVSPLKIEFTKEWCEAAAKREADCDFTVGPTAAQQDCRTCKSYIWTDSCWQGDDCTNGDKYQPAPKVVLWRTE